MALLQRDNKEVLSPQAMGIKGSNFLVITVHNKRKRAVDYIA